MTAKFVIANIQHSQTIATTEELKAIRERESAEQPEADYVDEEMIEALAIKKYFRWMNYDKLFKNTRML